MTTAESILTRIFAAFSVSNFRLYFAGQVVSVSGSWMQRVAQSWLVLDIANSAAAVGALTAVQFLPILLLAPRGGVTADRHDKRHVLFTTQSLAGLIALSLGMLILTGAVELWMVFVLAGAQGVVESFDNPARQTFVMEIVGRQTITNALALNSVLINSARVVGPAIGGVLIVSVGIGWCFVLNASSYLVFIWALVRMNVGKLHQPRPEEPKRGQLVDTFWYVRRSKVLSTTLVSLVVFGVFAYEFEVVLPVLARFTFGGEADTFGTMFAFMGVGAVAGGLYVASRPSTPNWSLSVASLSLACASAMTALSSTLTMVYAALIAVGAAASAFLTLSNSVLQTNAEPRMRGRVLGLRATAVLGARPIGGPIIGWVSDNLGPRWAMAVGSASCLVIAAWTWTRLRPGR